MDILNIIKNRRSVRTFKEIEIKSEIINQILEFANNVVNPYNIEIEWSILNSKEYNLSSPVIVGASHYIIGKMKKIDHAAEAFGYSFEKIVLFIHSLGLGTTWIAGTMDRKSFEKAVNLQEDEVMPCISPIGYEAEKMSIRESMMRKAIKADSRKDFDELFFEKTFDNPITNLTTEMEEALNAIKLAPSAVNKQPWRILRTNNLYHFYLSKNKAISSSDSWDIQKVDLGIAIAHFDLVLDEYGISHSFVLKKPEIITPSELYYIATIEIK